MARLSRRERTTGAGVNRYTATKEECGRLLKLLPPPETTLSASMRDNLLAFLTAALRRLPTKSAVERDLNRRLRSCAKDTNVRADHD